MRNLGMHVLANQSPTDRCHRSCIGFFPAIPAGSVHGRGHGTQMVWLRSIKHRLSDGRCGMDHASVEAQGRRPCLVAAIVIAGTNHLLGNDRRQVLTHRVVHTGYTVTGVGVVRKLSAKNEVNSMDGSYPPMSLAPQNWSVLEGNNQYAPRPDIGSSRTKGLSFGTADRDLARPFTC